MWIEEGLTAFIGRKKKKNCVEPRIQTHVVPESVVLSRKLLLGPMLKCLQPASYLTSCINSSLLGNTVSIKSIFNGWKENPAQTYLPVRVFIISQNGGSWVLVDLRSACSVIHVTVIIPKLDSIVVIDGFQ